MKKQVRRQSGTMVSYILIVAVCAACALSWALDVRGAEPSGNAPPAKKPNIIVVLADDFSWNLIKSDLYLPPVPNAECNKSNVVCYMPNVVKMQQDGMTFTNYFVSNSLCCPSRSSIFTGKFPHNTGVWTNSPSKNPTPPPQLIYDGGFVSFNKNKNELHTFALALQQPAGGYQTAMLGKYLNGYEPPMKNVPPRWDEWDVAGEGYPEFNYDLHQYVLRPESDSVVHYGIDPGDYLTDVLARLAVKFIQKQKSAASPFFMEIATFAPHAPYRPAYEDEQKFPGLKAPRPASYGARPGPDAPDWLKDIPALSLLENDAIDDDFRLRVQSVQAIDRMIGQIRSTLAAIGADMNTYIFFSSDNGLHMGEYSLRPGKMTPFDIDIHVPLIVVGPGVPKGHEVNEIVQNVDLCPTFTELGGNASPTEPDGHSLVPLLQGKTPPVWRHVALVEHHGPPDDPSDPDRDPDPKISANPPNYEALRTENALYVEYEGGEKGYYDLSKDPSELVNKFASLPPVEQLQLQTKLSENTTCGEPHQPACWDVQQ